MKSSFLALSFLFICTAAFSQTKKIAHRSHSGSKSTFSITGPDNFGLSPEVEERKKKQEKLLADSIARKAIADSIAKRKKIQPAPSIKKKKQHS